MKPSLQNLNPSSVLDLGCGKGIHSKIFLQKNISVTGIDKKPCKIEHPKFTFLNQDIQDFEFNKKYGLIIASNILHFFKKQKAIDLIKKIKSNTLEEEYNFLVCFTPQDDFYDSEHFFPTENELKELYSDWEIISFKKIKKTENHDNLGEHTHHQIKLLVKKWKN